MSDAIVPASVATPQRNRGEAASRPPAAVSVPAPAAPTHDRRSVTALGLAALLLGALALRAYGITFGLPHLYYWDEPTVVNRAIRFGSGDLNPHFFYYPALYMYVLFVVSGLYFVAAHLSGHLRSVQDFAAQYFVDPTGVYLAARFTTALVGAASVGLTYLVGRRYFDPLAGYLGATFLAVSVLHATMSHVAVTDVPQGLFIIAAYLPLHAIVTRRPARWRDYALCGLLIGLGMATKYLAVLLAPSLLLAHYLGGAPAPTRLRRLPRLVACWLAPELWVGLLAVGAGFFIGSPFNMLNWRAFIADYQAQAALAAGDGAGGGAAFFLAHVLPADLGWPLLAVSLAGLLLLAARRERVSAVFLLFPLLYFLFMLRYTLLFARYMVPEDPFLALTAGALVASAWRAFARNRGGARPALASSALALVALVLIAPPLLATLRWDALMASAPDSRTEALTWADATLPAGSVVAVQSLFDRTFFNAPLVTDRSIARVEQDIPRGRTFDAVRGRVDQALRRQPVFREIPFQYDYDALKAAGVQYLFLSDANWSPDRLNATNPRTPEERFAATLQSRAELLRRFPGATLPGANADQSLYPVIPPTISVYQVR